jgi:hypothetical protein
MSERALAADLDRALAGAPAGDEARALAALLVAAAEPAQFEVTHDEIDAALARSPRTPSVPRLRSPLRIGAVAAVAAAALAALFIPRAHGDGVQARAAAAVEATYFAQADVTPARRGLFPVTHVSGYVDGRLGRARVDVFSGNGTLIAETALRANGSVQRWLVRTNTIVTAPGCESLPGGCGETFDPLGLYVRSLEDARAHVRRVGDEYELRLPAGRVEQLVRVSAETYLPRRIVWRQDGRPVATIRFTTLQRTRARSDAEWRLGPHPGARVVELNADGRRVRIERVTPAKPTSGIRWLGPRFRGARAVVENVELTGGTATRITYGRLVVWNYRSVTPPDVLQGRGPAEKVFALPDGAIVHAFFGLSARQVAVVTYGTESVGIVSTTGDHVDVVRAAQRLRRPGSP